MLAAGDGDGPGLLQSTGRSRWFRRALRVAEPGRQHVPVEAGQELRVRHPAGRSAGPARPRAAAPRPCPPGPRWSWSATGAAAAGEPAAAVDINVVGGLDVVRLQPPRHRPVPGDRDLRPDAVRHRVFLPRVSHWSSVANGRRRHPGARHRGPHHVICAAWPPPHRGQTSSPKTADLANGGSVTQSATSAQCPLVGSGER